MSELSGIQQSETTETLRIKVIGVGGAGSNAVDHLKLDDLGQIELAAVNTDGKTLNASLVAEKLMLGKLVTRGLSAGGDPELGAEAAEADRDALRRMVDGVDLVFLVAGLGGGTGSGAAPILAEEAEQAGALTIAFVTMPFTFEGNGRRKKADTALTALRDKCHAVIPLPNDLLLQASEEEATVLEAFAVAEEWVRRGIRAICSMLFTNGLINVDFASLREAFRFRGGKTLFGVAEGTGDNPVEAALRDLDLCPLLHLPEYRYLKKADSLLVHLEGGPELSMAQVNQVLSAVTEKLGTRDNVVLGAVIDGNLRHTLRVTLLGTTDIGGPVRRQRRLPPKAKSLPVVNVAPPTTTEAQGERLAPAGVTAPQPDNASTQDEPQLLPGQTEFLFGGAGPKRGLFEDTDANLHESEDLDIPTFLRRGIRVQL